MGDDIVVSPDADGAAPDSTFRVGAGAYEGDIVSRLRNWRHLHLAHGGAMFEEAADEIVKIRRQVEDLRGRSYGETDGNRGVLDTTGATLAEACGEIDKLRARLRLADAALRSDSPTLTDAERGALEVACQDLRHTEEVVALRGLLERTK